MSEALRLAELIERDYHDETLAPRRAAAELRRLHDLVTEDSILQRRQRDEIAQLKTELAEQARVNGMGGEREAKLMAVNAELVRALRKCDEAMTWELGGEPLDTLMTDARNAARAALAKAEANK